MHTEPGDQARPAELAEQGGPVPWPENTGEATATGTGTGTGLGGGSGAGGGAGGSRGGGAGGGAVPEQRDDERDVAFWDWAPADDAVDDRFSVDDDPDGGSDDGSDGGPDGGSAGGGGRGPAAARPGAAGRTTDPTAAGPTAAGPRAAGPGAAGPRAAPVVTPVEYADVTPPAEGIGHRFGKLDHIFGDTRMGAWRRRVVLAIVVGVLVTILVNWRLGVTAAVVVAIADAIIRSRSVPPQQPGVKMTKAQRMTQRQLIKLERSGYRALHSRLIPESVEHIDHLVIGPAGVFAIDSESWDKQLPVRTKNARQLWHGPFSMKERLEHAKWEAGQGADYLTQHAEPGLLASLPDHRVHVRPAMAVYGPRIPWDIATIRDVDVFSGGRLRTYLRRYARQNHTRPLNRTQIEQIWRAAHSAFPDHDPGVPAASPFN